MVENLHFMQLESHYFKLINLLKENFYVTFILFIFFLPNLALKIKPAVVGASQSWSVGVEEQFYLIWPLAIQKINNKFLPVLFLFIIIVYPQLGKIVNYFNPAFSNPVSLIIQLLPIQIMH
jgi:peptidoglycan/LPS O-acetylase OafA/YrhL